MRKTGIETERICVAVESCCLELFIFSETIQSNFCAINTFFQDCLIGGFRGKHKTMSQC